MCEITERTPALATLSTVLFSLLNHPLFKPQINLFSRSLIFNPTAGELRLFSVEEN